MLDATAVSVLVCFSSLIKAYYPHKESSVCRASPAKDAKTKVIFYFYFTLSLSSTGDVPGTYTLGTSTGRWCSPRTHITHRSPVSNENHRAAHDGRATKNYTHSTVLDAATYQSKMREVAHPRTCL